MLEEYEKQRLQIPYDMKDADMPLELQVKLLNAKNDYYSKLLDIARKELKSISNKLLYIANISSPKYKHNLYIFPNLENKYYKTNIINYELRITNYEYHFLSRMQIIKYKI